MAPNERFAPKEELRRLLDTAPRLLKDAAAQRNIGKTAEAHEAYERFRQHRAAIEALLTEIGEAPDKRTGQEILLLDAEAALLEANIKSQERRLSENRAAYYAIIQLARTTESVEIIGRAFASYGAVLLYFREWREAVAPLKSARQYMDTPDHYNEWVNVSYRLSIAYVQVGQLEDALPLLREITAWHDIHRDMPLTANHLAAAALLAHIAWRQHNYRSAQKIVKDMISRTASRATTLSRTGEYVTLVRLRTRRGHALYWAKLLRQHCTRPRHLDI